MFISRVKAKGQFYFYAYVYDSSSDRGMKTVHSFGRKEKALNEIANWKNPSSIPGQLIDLGLKVENLDKWRKKIEAV
jgi:hypothetical protein